jgi:hypoxanthine-DNA glycosylase
MPATAPSPVTARAPGAGRGARGRLLGLEPVAGPNARLAVLGSFPSVASLQAQQYYAHPRNQFWPILAALWCVDWRACSPAARLAEVRRRGLAIWDVYASCRRDGSLDASIEDAHCNDLAAWVATLPALEGIAHNGGESARAMRLTRTLGLPVHRLPSTSPANASWSFERKLAAWREVFDDAGVA